MQSSKPIIAVFGASGQQGGAAIEALIKSKNYHIRALTTNPKSKKMEELGAKGIEVTLADFNDIESLKKALHGVHGAYLVTPLNFDPAIEFQQGKNMGDACLASSVKHVIWSSLEDTRPTLSKDAPLLAGGYTVPHFDCKDEISKYFKKINLPYTNLCTSFFYENFLSFFKPRKGEDGSYSMTYNLDLDTVLPLTSIQDIGEAATLILNEGIEKWHQKTHYIAFDAFTISDIVKIFSDILGKNVTLNSVSNDTYRGFKYPGADEFGNMLQYFRENKHHRSLRDIEACRKWHSKYISLKDFLEAHKDELKI